MIRFAVVGYGHIGRRHAAIIQQHPECELLAVCDTANPGDLPAAPFFSSLEALLAAGLPLDVVNICTPNGYHAAQAIQSLEAGCHVVVEKPMGLSRAECEQVVFKALQRNRQVFCVMQNRYSPAAAWLKQAMDQNLLGDIYTVQVNCFWNRDDRYYLPGGQPHPWHGHPQLDGGVLFTQFAHFIDLLYWVFGDIERISGALTNVAHAHSAPFADTGAVHFHLVRGGLGSLHFSTAVWDRNFESSITAIGSRGSVRLGGQYMNEITHCHIKDYEMPALPPAAPPNDYGGYTGSAANHHFVIQNVADVLNGRETTATNALEGLKVVDMIERIYLGTRDEGL